MKNCPKGLKYAFSRRKEIHPCVLQDIGPFGPLPKKEKFPLCVKAKTIPFFDQKG